MLTIYVQNLVYTYIRKNIEHVRLENTFVIVTKYLMVLCFVVIGTLKSRCVNSKPFFLTVKISINLVLACCLTDNILKLIKRKSNYNSG